MEIHNVYSGNKIKLACCQGSQVLSSDISMGLRQSKTAKTAYVEKKNKEPIVKAFMNWLS